MFFVNCHQNSAATVRASAIKELVKRHNRRERKLEQGIVPKLKGRPRKQPLTSEEEKDKEIARLRMENE